jgi:hypothetical protein
MVVPLKNADSPILESRLYPNYENLLLTHIPYSESNGIQTEDKRISSKLFFTTILIRMFWSAYMTYHQVRELHIDLEPKHPLQMCFYISLIQELEIWLNYGQ